MGTVSPATNLRLNAHKRIMQEIIVPTIAGMDSEGRRFQGILYAGLMMTESGPKVLEFNARFGDPEAQAIMARMRSDIVPLFSESTTVTDLNTYGERRRQHSVGDRVSAGLLPP